MSHPVRAVLLATLLVVSAAFAGVGFGSAGAVAGDGAPMAPSLQEEEDPTENVTLDPADEVWVDSEGNLVLRYDSQNDSEVDDETGPDATSDTDLEYGLAVGEGLFYSLVTANSTMDAPDAANATEGEFHALLTTGRLNGTGSLVAPRPDAIQSMTLDVEGVRTREDARFDASTEVVVSNEEAGTASLLENAQVNLQAEVGPRTFTSTGSLDASLQTALGPAQSQSFSVTESDGSYTIDAAQDYRISSFTVERWNTSARAEQTLNAQYASVAQSLGGSAAITLESYDFTRNSDGSGRLDVEYTVEYTGIEEGLSQQLAFQLASAEDVNLTQAEATEVAQQVTELQVNDVSASFEQTAQGQVTGSYSVDIENYDTVVEAGLTVAESVNSTEFAVQAEQIEQARTQLEAQRAANLVRTYSLTTDVASGAETTTVNVEAQSRSQNWAAYVQELESEGIPFGSLTYSLTGGTDGDDIALDGEFTLEQEDIVGEAISQFERSLNASATGETETDTAEVRRYLRAFEAAEFQRARTDVTFSNGELRVEAGAKFDNLAALRDVVAVAQGDGLTVTEVVGRTEGNTTNSYVYVRGGVSGDASEEDVRALSVVDENTTVHMPGTWDRSFPEMDRDRARNYLGLTPTPTASPTSGSDGNGGGSGDDQQTPDGSSGDGAGFGVGVALVALLAAALLAVRRS